MSDFLTLGDVKHLKQSQRDMCLWDQLIEVAFVAAKRYNSDETSQKQQVKVKEIPLKVCRRRHHNNKEKNLTSYIIKDCLEVDCERLIKGINQVKECMINKSPQKADILKRKFEQTMTNEEWINLIELKRKKQKSKKNGCLNPPQPLASLDKEYEEMILQELHGSGIMIVIQKTLQATDVSKNHNRLSIPCIHVDSFEFLKDCEMTRLRSGETITVPLVYKPRRNGVPLPLSDISLEFKQWDLHKNKEDCMSISYQYVLRTKWNTLVSRGELKVGDDIQVWAFRDGYDKLCMALVKLS